MKEWLNKAAPFIFSESYFIENSQPQYNWL